MSPQVSNFVHELVDMAKAVELVPQLQREVDELHSKLSEAERHNQGLETNIISYKSQIDDLQVKVRSLEVERDDASFRVLEAEETNHDVLAKARAMEDILKGIVSKLDPPKPQPEPEKVIEPEQSYADAHPKPWEPLPDPMLASQGQSEASPTNDGLTKPVTDPISSEPTDSDPEPEPRWSYDWYAWNDRRHERERQLRASF